MRCTSSQSAVPAERLFVCGEVVAVANKRSIARGKWSHGLVRRGQQERWRDATVYIITFPRWIGRVFLTDQPMEMRRRFMFLLRLILTTTLLQFAWIELSLWDAHHLFFHTFENHRRVFSGPPDFPSILHCLVSINDYNPANVTIVMLKLSLKCNNKRKVSQNFL